MQIVDCVIDLGSGFYTLGQMHNFSTHPHPVCYEYSLTSPHLLYTVGTGFD